MMKQLLAKHDAQTGVGPAFACGGDPTIYHSTPAPDVVEPNQGSSILPDILGDLVFWKDPIGRLGDTKGQDLIFH